MNWRKFKMPETLAKMSGLNFQPDIYEAQNGNRIWTVVDAGLVVTDETRGSEFLHGMPVRHFQIFIHDGKKHFEPTYSEKIKVLQELGMWKNIALEIFPKKADVVDVEDVYHIWEFEFPYSAQINFQDLTIQPDDNEFKTYNDVEYSIKGNCLFLRRLDGKELSWKRKQEMKDNILGKDKVAVELISDEYTFEATCLILVKNVDFGLEPPLW